MTNELEALLTELAGMEKDGKPLFDGVRKPCPDCRGKGYWEGEETFRRKHDTV